LQPKTPPVVTAAKIAHTLCRSFMGLSFCRVPETDSQRVRPRRSEYPTSVTRELAVVTRSDSRLSEKPVSRDDSSKSLDILATSIATSLTAGTSRYIWFGFLRALDGAIRYVDPPNLEVGE
jgi:hypothetical protein